MPQKFYLVAVPIGNLEEITYLGKKILETSKVIFCEDVRVTSKLLNLLGIRNNQELIKLNRFNESSCLELVLSKLNNCDCAMVSDAGYPVISDPGYFLVKSLRKLGISIQVVNGPCAFIHAIVGSGIDSRKIFFAGFLTKKYLKRKQELIELKNVLKISTLIYYETKNFFLNGLEILKEVFGDIVIGVGRELSKLNEEFYFDQITNIQKTITLKGEFVVIVPRQDLEDKDISLDSILEYIHEELSFEKKTLRELCKEKSCSKYTTKEIYESYVKRYRN